MSFRYDLLFSLRRYQKVSIQLFSDTTLMVLAYTMAIFLESGDFNFLYNHGAIVALFLAITLALFTFSVFGFYRVLIRAVTGNVVWPVAAGTLAATLLLYLSSYITDIDLNYSAIVNFFLFSFLAIVTLRFMLREYARSSIRSKTNAVLIFGAGEAGLQLLNALFHGDEFFPVGLIDDDVSLRGMTVGGVRVYSRDQISEVSKSLNAKIVLLAIPTLSPDNRRKIVSELNAFNLEIRTIPGMSDIISGKAQISEIRKISPEDLLGREPIFMDTKVVKKNIIGRAVMVSGAGGSIGSEICRQILSYKPSVLILYEMSELALYSIEAELSEMAAFSRNQTNIVSILGSVQDRNQLEATISAFKIDTIYHTAAYKHVPLVEGNVVAGIMNNVFGTLEITQAAKKFKVKNFILISTDKAVRPANIMGATKRIAELICQAHAKDKPQTVFSMVRFGNVLGSSGSVIPRFRKQIEGGGPVTVTHKDITRYFMTIPEAAQLVIKASTMCQGGEVFVLDMGQPIKIMDLAFEMIKLHGFIPDLVDQPDQINFDKEKIPVCVTGLRNGEKLYEELLIGNTPEKTAHPRIMTASEVSVPYDLLMTALDRLKKACEEANVVDIVQILHELPLDYVPPSHDIHDVLWGEERVVESSQHIFTNSGDTV